VSTPDNLTIRLLRELRADMEAGFKRLEQRSERIEAKPGEHHDEIAVASALALRATGERVGRGTLRRRARQLGDRLAAVESDLARLRDERRP
jgi:hypothetical protein